MLAKHVDEVVFVVEADSTPEPAAANAIDELLDITPNVSLLLNRCLISDGGFYYGSYEDYYAREDKARTPAAPPLGPGGPPANAGDEGRQEKGKTNGDV